MSRRRQRQRLPKDPIELNIESLSHDGRGIATLDGKKIFVDGALTGETASCLYTRKKKSFDEAKVIEVLTPSPVRIEAKCPHFGVCGGCSMQHLSQQSQIEHKQSVLLDHYQHYADLTIDDPIPPLTADPWGYRRKARLGVKYVEKKGGVLIGFREKHQPNLITNMQSCDILHPCIAELLPSMRDLLGKLSIPQHIPQLEVAVGDDASAVIIRHLEDLNATDLELITQYAQEQQVHIYSQRKGYDSIIKLWPDDNQARLHYHLPKFNLSMAFHPTDFTQVNSAINQKMIDIAIELLAPNSDEHILDLFCGLGNFSLPIAKFAKSVIGVEGDANMVDRAYENAKANQIANADFYSADLTQDMSQQPWAKEKFAKILLDPPRSGAQDIIAHFPKLDAWRIVYISCDPATLARDAAILQQQGYQLIKTGVMDMFPQTSHVESIALFEKV